MRNYITFGDIDTRDYGIYISGTAKHKIPQRPYEVVQIPGRMGDLIVGGNMLANEEISYPAFIAPVDGMYGNYATYEEAVSAFRNAILCVNGYADLTDTYDVNHYRKAVFTGPTDIDTTDKLDAGSFTLVFNAKPQRYIVGEDTPLTIAAGASATVNCKGKRSAPIITVTGAGSFTLTGDNSGLSNTVTINQNDSVIIVDGERKECYDEYGNSRNIEVEFARYAFPAINQPFGAMDESVTIEAVGVNLSIVFNWYVL